MSRTSIRSAGAIAILLLVAGCAMPNPQRATVVAQPSSPVVKNLTSFTNSLRCMDDLFIVHKKKDIVITSNGLPDQTGQIRTGTKEMMISALSRMSTKSNAFRFVDVEPGQDTVFWIQQNWIGIREGLLAPNYYVRGAITQVDGGVMADSKSFGFSIPEFSLGYSKDQLVSVVSMDMNIGDIVTRQIMPGMSSTNSVAVMKTGKGVDTEGLIKKAGAFLRVSDDQSQGSHQSVRTLVELGLIEVLGKLTQVPYWKCLEIESASPEMMANARDWYDSIVETDRIRLTQTILGRQGLYKGPADGAANAELRDAVSRYKSKHDLIADGRVDFNLYYSFLINNLAVRGDEKQPQETLKPIAASAPAGAQANNQTNTQASAAPAVVDLRLELDGGRDRVFSVGESLRFSVAVDKEAFVYCYYRDDTGSVVRVFPSRFQDNPRVTPSAPVTIPGRSAGYSIALEKRGADEQVSCVATEKSYGSSRPAVLDEGDLRPLRVTTIEAAIDQHVAVDRSSTSVRQLQIKVR